MYLRTACIHRLSTSSLSLCLTIGWSFTSFSLNRLKWKTQNKTKSIRLNVIALQNEVDKSSYIVTAALKTWRPSASIESAVGE